MKRAIVLALGLLAVALLALGCDGENPALSSAGDEGLQPAAKKGGNAATGGCLTIQSGQLYTIDGAVITTGYDDWGYNYQAHLFNGDYCKSDRNDSDCGDGEDTQLAMKWNDAWLSNKDCDSDGLLDRHHGFDSYIGSGAWLTNHQSGTYADEGGNTCNWTYFVKIVAPPADAEAVDGIWYAADGTEIGEVIWGAFAIIQQVENDPCGGIHGAQYISPAGPGFGQYSP